MELRNDSVKAGEEMLSFAKQLFPLNRSIMGPDIRRTYDFFKAKHPDLKPLIFKSGDKVFDWIVPMEWSIRDAYLEHESGTKFADFRESNLHVMGYSEPVDMQLRKEDLIGKIHVHPFFKDAIPYVTSYYKRDWAFCMSSDQVAIMPEGTYKVFIDSTLEDGELVLQELVIRGTSDHEIFFSSYLCHPSLANDELSGPVLLSKLVEYVQSFPNLNYSYRFVLLPETIGSIAYLSKRIDTLKKNVICGFNLSCVGDERGFSRVASRQGNSIADIALQSSLQELDNVTHYTFMSRGSDERQYCAPGVDLPLCTFSKSKVGAYEEYHSDKDNFDVVTAKGLAESYEVMTNIIAAFELGLYPKVRVLGEPQLGKRGLYPVTSKLNKGVHPAALRMNIISQCDGATNSFDISNRLEVNLSKVLQELRLLSSHDLVELSAT